MLIILILHAKTISATNYMHGSNMLCYLDTAIVSLMNVETPFCYIENTCRNNIDQICYVLVLYVTQLRIG